MVPNTKGGTHYDFVPEAVAGSGLSVLETIIIESNTSTQVNVKQMHTVITWANGLPSLVEKYEDATLLNKLWTITPTFINGLPSTIVVVNEDDARTETTTLTFVGDELSTINKV